MFHSFTNVGFNSRVWSIPHDAPSEDIDQIISLRAYGRVQCDGRFRLEQVHNLYAFHIFEDGSGTFELDGTAYSVTGGQMVIVWPGVHVRYYDDAGAPWRYRWFTLYGEDVDKALMKAGLSSNTPLIGPIDPHHFLDVFSRIESAFETDPTSSFMSNAFAYELLSKLADLQNSPPVQDIPSIVNRAQFIIQQDYHQALQVEDIARRLDVSRATLFRRFREVLGVSPKAYLDDFRLRQAYELLQRGRSTVKEVAFACGYRCPHYFSNAYKKRYGRSPSQAIDPT